MFYNKALVLNSRIRECGFGNLRCTSLIVYAVGGRSLHTTVGIGANRPKSHRVICVVRFLTKCIGIGFWEPGSRNFYSKDPITCMDDIKGMKIRCQQLDIDTDMVKALGASPTPIAAGEVYSALQTGVVDGAEQPIANYKSNAFPEVANNMILDGHTLGAIQAVITDTAWAKLTADQQAVLLEAGKLTQQFNADLSEGAENEVLDQLKAEGCNIVEVTNKAEWAEACKDIISQSSANHPDLYQQILDLAK